MATVFFYLHIFTGSVGSRILLVVLVDTLYRTSINSSSTVLPLNLFVNLSLAPLSLFLTYGSDLRVWPDCWVLRAPIPRKGSVIPPPPWRCAFAVGKRAEISSAGMSNITDDLILSTNGGLELTRHCRRHTRGVELTTKLEEDLRTFYCGPGGFDVADFFLWTRKGPGRFGNLKGSMLPASKISM